MAATHAIIVQNGKTLFVERRASGYWDGYLGLVAGHLEDQESVVECVRREVMEEIGISFEPAEFHLAHTMHRRSSDGARLDFFFTAALPQHANLSIDQREIASCVWCEIEDAERRVVPYIRRAFQEMATGSQFSWFVDVLFPGGERDEP